MLIQKATCKLCGKKFGQITHTHLMKSHGISLKEYIIQFPDAELYESTIPNEENGKELLLEELERQWANS